MSGYAAVKRADFANAVLLRDVTEDDLPAFFEMQLDLEANKMAAFTATDPADRNAFMAHWNKILGDDTIIKRTIVFEGQVAGNIASFLQLRERELCYWIHKNHWGKGIASKALSEFLAFLQVRPLFARAAKDNIASIRVLEKCGFTICGYEKGFANARGEEIEEVLLKLR
jgi:RimJ/RimL family protein N-acetyltransferase